MTKNIIILAAEEEISDQMGTSRTVILGAFDDSAAIDAAKAEFSAKSKKRHVFMEIGAQLNQPARNWRP